MKIKELIKISHDNAIEKGFWDYPKRNIGELLMLIVSELSEALEADRKNKKAYINPLTHSKLEKSSFKTFFEKNIKNSFEDEIADCFIRLADLCGGLNIDIEYFIKAKTRYNKTREKLHGKKY